MNEDISESKRVLVVDDDKTTVLLTRLFLESMSVTDVHSSSNGEEALQFIYNQCSGTEVSASCPDIILLDLNMPVMDGFEFLEAYAKVAEFKNKGITIIVLTSSDSKRDRDRVQQSNVNIAGYIVKPLTEEKIKPYLF